MKIKKIFPIVSSLLCITFLFSSCFFDTHKKTDFSKVEFVYENQNYHFYDTLDLNEKIAYTVIVNAAKEHPETIEVPMLDNASLDKVFDAVLKDHPEILCFGRSVELFINEHDAYFYTPEYQYDKAECDQKTAQMQEKIDAFLTNVPENASDYEKELLVHDYLCETCKYVVDENNHKGSAYDALVVGEAVCEGYAKAAQILLRELGIESYLIEGEATNKEGKTEPHLWNIVRIDNKNYHLDVTWDDIDNDKSTFTHSFFNVSDTVIAKSRKNLIPSDNNCVSTDMNYFVQSNLMFTTHNKSNDSKIANAAAKNISNQKEQIEIAFMNETAFQKAKKEYIDKSGFYSVLNEINKIAKKKYTTVEYSVDDLSNTMQFYFA